MTTPAATRPRYLRVLRLFWSTSLAAELEYRTNFALAAASSLGNLALSVFALSLFYQGGYTFDGWRWEEALVVMGLSTLLQGFAAAFLRPNLGRIVRHVETGTLDFVLLKPIDSQFWLSTRTVSPWGLPDLGFGLAVVAWAAWRLELPWTAWLLALPAFVCAVATLYGLWFILGATSIWFVKVYNVTEVLRGLLEAGRFPMAAYPAAWRFFFTFVVPVAFLTTTPAEWFLGRGATPWLLGAVALSLAMLLAARAFWRFALRYYTSASS